MCGSICKYLNYSGLVTFIVFMSSDFIFLFPFLFSVMGNKCAQTGHLDMAVEYFTDAIKHNPREFK